MRKDGELPKDPEILRAMAIVGNVKHEVSRLVDPNEPGAAEMRLELQTRLIQNVVERQPGSGPTEGIK